MISYLGATLVCVCVIIFLLVLVIRYRLQTTNMTLQESKKLPHVLMPCYQVVPLKLVFNFDFCTCLNLPAVSIRYSCRLQLDILVDFCIYTSFMKIQCVQIASFLSKTKESFCMAMSKSSNFKLSEYFAIF